MNFRLLSEQEKEEFRAWARENYKVPEPISEVWHPVVQDECKRMREEAFNKISEFIIDGSTRAIEEINFLLECVYTERKPELTFNEAWGEVLNGEE